MRVAERERRRGPLRRGAPDGITRRIAASSSFNSIGLVTKSFMPAARHSNRSAWNALAVIATIGQARISAAPCSDLARRIETVHARHLHIHEDEIVTRRLQLLERFDAVAGDIDLMAEGSQHPAPDDPVDRHVLDEKDV